MEATATTQEIERFKVEQGDNIITKDSETPDDIGIPAVVLDEIPNLVCGYHLALIKPKREKVDPIYLSKQLGSTQSAIYFSRLANGSTRYGLSSSAISSMRIPLAPLAEQRHIANVLAKLDNAIAKTESLIAKYQQIKAGLMHDLFTRGVTADGKLRPPREQAPELYHETPIGWIARDIKVVPLGNLYSVPSRNGLYKPAEYYGSGVPMVHMPQMFRGPIVDVTDAVRVDLSVGEKSRFDLQEGDMLFARRSLTVEGAGQCSIVPVLNECTSFESSIIRVRLNKKVALPAYINYFLNTDPGFRSRRPYIRQVAVSGVAAEDVKSFLVPLPKILEEQQIVVERIDSLNRVISQESNKLSKLNKQKSGLMHDLLTGKVRTKA
jgi:type I restriction enzyme S subunit